jgi:hypothetical protein
MKYFLNSDIKGLRGGDKHLVIDGKRNKYGIDKSSDSFIGFIKSGEKRSSQYEL